MKFIDEVEITVTAGKGGAGCKSFRREKFVPLGGPDGGNGGHGGSVIFTADANLLTLLDFRLKPLWKAQDGKPGSGSRREGKSGQDLVIKVPVGTEIIDTSKDTLICDLAEKGKSFKVAKGGRGGKGNDFFKSPTNRAPEKFQPGEEGENRNIRLSLKLMADVALIGFPNAGKSTLISRLSEARPKIADYPFTTLVPNLGVVRAGKGKSFVIADIPGLISGAHEGKGLGIKFLKHIERTRLLLHLIDLNIYNESSEVKKVFEKYKEIRNELEMFSDDLVNKPEIIVLTKTDVISEKKKVEEIRKLFTKKKLECLAISSATGDGIKDLMTALSKKVF
jgi:GTP-binding protein